MKKIETVQSSLETVDLDLFLRADVALGQEFKHIPSLISLHLNNFAEFLINEHSAVCAVRLENKKEVSF